MAIRYAVDLTDTERTELQRLSPRIRPNEVRSLTLIFYSRPNGPVVGQMQTLLWRMKYPPKKLSSSRNVLSKKVLKLLCIANR